MAAKYYLFQKATGEWVFGINVNSICPGGTYRLDVDASSKIAIRAVNGRDSAFMYSSLFSDYMKENGSAYASLSEFITAVKGFFSGQIYVSISAGDINIGAVELKDALSEDRAKIGAGNAVAKADKALAVADASLRSKMFPEGVHFLVGTDPAPAGVYSGFTPLADDTAISSISILDGTKTTGPANLAGVTLVVGRYYEIPGGFSTLTLSAGDMELTK